MGTGSALMITGVDCAKGLEKEFNEWYNCNYPPVLLKVPGVIRMDRYERVEDDEQLPRFLNIIQLENEAVMEEMAKSDAVREVGRVFFDEGAKWGTQMLWAVRYRRIYTSEK